MNFPTLRRALLVALLLTPLGLAAAQQDKSGWIDLLESKDLKTHWTTTGNWILKDGVITLEPRPGEKGWQRYDAYLWSRKQFKDFECEFEYKVAKSGNSGFYFRVGDLKEPVKKGIEVQIYDSASKAKDAKLTDHDSGGIIPGVPPTKNAAKPAGEWNRMSVSCKDDRLTVELNGQTVNEVNLKREPLRDRPETGSVGFQDHGLPIRLKRVRIKPI